LDNLEGAKEDFIAARDSGEVEVEQRSNLGVAIAEVETALAQRDIDQANAAFARGDYDLAISRARRVLASDPNSLAATTVLIDSLSRSGQKEQALEEADRLVARDPAKPLPHAQRGFIRREVGNIPGAVEDFTAALQSSELQPEQRQNVEAAIAEAKAFELQRRIDEAQKALSARKYNVAIEITNSILLQQPNSLPALNIRIEAMIRSGRKKEALALVDHAVINHLGGGPMLAQRGFLRRQFGNTAGALTDFEAALDAGDLSAEQRKNVQASIIEAQNTGRISPFQVAQNYLNKGQYAKAAEVAGDILRRQPNSEPALRIRFAALSRAGRTNEAIADADRLIGAGYGRGWVYAERGYLKRGAGDLPGAVSDFDAALARNDMGPQAASNLRYTRTETLATIAEKDGNFEEAANVYAAFLTTDQSRSEAWYSYGYIQMKANKRQVGADALRRGIDLRPTGNAYFDAAAAYIFTNAPLASQLYRQGLDRWYARDPSVANRTPQEIEQIRNEVVIADASVQTSLGYGGIASRPDSAGGTSNNFYAETLVRFDGRYLASIPGLEFIAHGFIGKDSTGTEESAIGAGLRYRLLRAIDMYREVDLYVGAVVDQFFQPNSLAQVVVIWGFGYGTNPYPYDVGWKAYGDIGAFGSYRTGEGRTLQDLRTNLGFLYGVRDPSRFSIGPTLLAVGSYDSKANEPWAFGVGPSVLARFWLGGDKYRSYDAVLSLQIGYLFAVGNDERQRGWRGQVGLTF
jgi:tetratricopeptide (TPR) repeat protein